MFNAKLNYTWVRGAHSLKTGYEFQYVMTEVQDVNPLYGRDAYTGNFTRPAGVSANNVYNLADFMLGLRSQYALSSILVANLRQRYQFAYVQDDWRLNDKLTLNLGLRYEYATPWWENDNLMTNYDPAAKTMIFAKDGSMYDRALIDPDRNNWGPRLGLAYSLTPKTVVRGGWGMSYIHFHRIGAANILAINGPQVVNAVASQSNPTLPTFRTTQQGYPAGFADPSQFNPLTANILYMPEGLPLERRAELVRVGAARNREEHADRRGVRRQPGRRPARARELQPGRAEQRGGIAVAAGAAADPGVLRHHLHVQRRQVALQRPCR